ncbi:hypothetical protein BYT27DRAFT_7247843 [Phlegmacium glaucopus]|nr:hypothetical protein BYT27DRAFT_7247843 [Phlegmacium glaucopus]
MQNILFLTAAHGTHIHHPTLTPPASTSNEPDDNNVKGLATLVSHPIVQADGHTVGDTCVQGTFESVALMDTNKGQYPAPPLPTTASQPPTNSEQSMWTV